MFSKHFLISNFAVRNNCRQLTFHIQRHGVTLAVTFLVATDARVNAGAASSHLLQHQALIAHDRAGRRIVVQQLSLRANKYKR